MYLDFIINVVKNNGLDIGLFFDGDGDCILVIDKDGIIYDGDYIVYIIVKYLKFKGKLKKDIVVLI